MKLYFCQQALAEPREVNPDRPLSKTGRQQTERIASYLKERNFKPTAIVHSGKTRAAQTAQIFANALHAEPPQFHPHMGPNDAPGLLIDHGLKDGTLYVGHLPHIQRVVCQLICGDDESERPCIRFCNGAVACVEIDGHNASLQWFIIPDMC